MLGLYVIMLCISKVVAGLSLGLLVMSRLANGQYKGSLVWPLVVGLVIIVLLSSIPFFGWALKLAAVLWAFGAIVTIKKQMLKEYR